MGRKEGGRRPAGRGRRQGLEAGSHAGPRPLGQRTRRRAGLGPGLQKAGGCPRFIVAGGKERGPKDIIASHTFLGRGREVSAPGQDPTSRGQGLPSVACKGSPPGGRA